MPFEADNWDICYPDARSLQFPGYGFPIHSLKVLARVEYISHDHCNCISQKATRNSPRARLKAMWFTNFWWNFQLVPIPNKPVQQRTCFLQILFVRSWLLLSQTQRIKPQAFDNQSGHFSGGCWGCGEAQRLVCISLLPTPRIGPFGFPFVPLFV